MSEEERLRSLLREWQASEPSAALDERVRGKFREVHPRWCRRLLTMRVSVPVPVMAAVMLVVAVLWFGLRASPPAVVAPAHSYANKVESAGFQPLPRGDARVIEVKERDSGDA